VPREKNPAGVRSADFFLSFWFFEVKVLKALTTKGTKVHEGNTYVACEEQEFRPIELNRCVGG
jgi:hypothetical protein